MKAIKYLTFLLLAFITANAQARFLSVDPLGFNESNPMSFNRYAYANNNPYKYVDPDGRSPLLLIPLAAAGILATNNAQAPTSAVDMHPNMDTQTIDAVGIAGAGAGILKAGITWGIAKQAAKNSIDDILRPNGDLIGDVARGATDNIRTVSPDKFGEIQQQLMRSGAKEVEKSGYGGAWHDLPGGGGFGIRQSKHGSTMDFDLPGFPKGLKIHQQ